MDEEEAMIAQMWAIYYSWNYCWPSLSDGDSGSLSCGRQTSYSNVPDDGISSRTERLSSSEHATTSRSFEWDSAVSETYRSV